MIRIVDKRLLERLITVTHTVAKKEHRPRDRVICAGLCGEPLRGSDERVSTRRATKAIGMETLGVLLQERGAQDIEAPLTHAVVDVFDDVERLRDLGLTRLLVLGGRRVKGEDPQGRAIRDKSRELTGRKGR